MYGTCVTKLSRNFFARPCIRRNPPVLQQSLKFLRPARARRPHPPLPLPFWRRPREALGRHPPHDRLPPRLQLQLQLRMRGGLPQQVLQLREGGSAGGGRGRGGGCCRRPEKKWDRGCESARTRFCVTAALKL